MLKDKRIHQSKIWQIMERRKDGKPLEFSIQFCKKSNGELVTYDRAVLTSFHSSGSTINVCITLWRSKHDRKIKRNFFIGYNIKGGCLFIERDTLKKIT